MYEQPEFSQTGNDQKALPAPQTASRGRERLVLVIAALLALALLAGMGWAIWALLQPGAPTETIRDVFIIVLALEFMLVGVTLVVMVIQLAKLVNMLQNEVRPILDSANEAANTLRGTAQFLSDKMVSPIVKANGAIAALRRAANMLNLGRK
jgi:hypothetical protein